MAGYEAQIRVSVQGLQSVDRLQKALEAASSGLDKLQKAFQKLTAPVLRPRLDTGRLDSDLRRLQGTLRGLEQPRVIRARVELEAPRSLPAVTQRVLQQAAATPGQPALPPAGGTSPLLATAAGTAIGRQMGSQGMGAQVAKLEAALTANTTALKALPPALGKAAATEPRRAAPATGIVGTGGITNARFIRDAVTGRPTGYGDEGSPLINVGGGGGRPPRGPVLREGLLDGPMAPRSLGERALATRRLRSEVDGLGSSLADLAIAYGGIQAARFVFVQTADLERQTKSLEVLTGSAQKAADVVQKLQQYANVTPFGGSELIDVAKRLGSFGVETDRIVEVTKRLGDIAGATGADLTGLSLAYGQVVAKGRVQGEELLQFQERGVAVQQELQKMYRLSGTELQKAIEKGQVPAKALEVAIERLTRAGGKYANGAIAQSDTLAGKLSTLQDAVAGLARTIGTILSPAIKGILTQATDAVTRITDLLKIATQGPQNKDILESLAGGRLPLFGAAGGGMEKVRKLVGESNFRSYQEQAMANAPLLGGSYEKKMVQLLMADPTIKRLMGAATATTPPPVTPPLQQGRAGDGAPSSRDQLAAIARLAYGPQIIAAARANGIDPALAAGLVQVESGFNQRAVSPAGAIGLAQLMPGTARDLGVNPRDPMQNLMGGMRYLRQQIDRFGSVTAGLRAYNQGPGNQQRYPGGVSAEAVAYPGKVLGAARRYGFGAEGMADADADALEAQQRARQQAAEQAQRRQQGLNSAAGEALDIERQRALIGKSRLEQLVIEDQYGQRILRTQLEGLNADRDLDPAVRAAQRQNLINQFQGEADQRQADYQDLLKQIKGVEDAAGDLGRTLGQAFAPPLDPLQTEIQGVREELLAADRQAEELLKTLSDLGGTMPETEAARTRLGNLRGRIAEANPEQIAGQRLARPLQQDLQGEAYRLQLERAAIREGRGLNARESLLLDPVYASLPKAQQDVLAKQAGINDALDAQNARLRQTVELTQAIGQAMAQGIGSAITGLIDGTKSLNEALGETLANIGQLLLQNAITGLLGGVELFGTPLIAGARAEGGPVSSGSSYLVGEQGPELFIPGVSGSILPNKQTAEVLKPAGDYGLGEPQPLEVSYNGPQYVIRDEEYVRKADVPKLIKAATANTASQMRSSVSFRRRTGI